MSAGEVAGQIREGVAKMNGGYGPLDTARGNAEDIARDLSEAYTALLGLQEVFAGLKNRIDTEVAQPAGAVKEAYEKARDLIVPALGESWNSNAEDARNGINGLPGKVEAVVDISTRATGNFLDQITVGIGAAVVNAQHMSMGLSGAAKSLDDIQTLHPHIASAAERYADGL